MIRTVALFLCGYGLLSGYAWTFRYMWGARKQARGFIAEAIAYSALGISMLVTGFFVVLIRSPAELPWYLLSACVGVLSSVMFTVWHFILGRQRVDIDEATIKEG